MLLKKIVLVFLTILLSMQNILPTAENFSRLSLVKAYLGKTAALGVSSYIISHVWPLKIPQILFNFSFLKEKKDQKNQPTSIQAALNVVVLGGLYATHKAYQALPLLGQQVSQAGLLIFQLLQLFGLGIVPYDPLNYPALMGIGAQALSHFGYVQNTQMLALGTLIAHYAFVKIEEKRIAPKEKKEEKKKKSRIENMVGQGVDDFRESLDDIYRTVLVVEQHAIQALITAYCLQYALKYLK